MRVAFVSGSAVPLPNVREVRRGPGGEDGQAFSVNAAVISVALWPKGHSGWSESACQAAGLAAATGQTHAEVMLSARACDHSCVQTRAKKVDTTELRVAWGTMFESV